MSVTFADSDPLGGAIGAAARRARATALDELRTWVDPNGYRLSDRLWHTGQLVRATIDQRLRAGIAAGDSAVTIAEGLTGFLRPGATQTTLTPNPIYNGEGSYPARRLARTEVTRAHGQATLRAAAENPFVQGVRWLVSTNHPDPDDCDDNATADNYGLGPGGYPADQVPDYPAHPQCRCTLSPIAMDTETAIVRIQAQYLAEGGA